jgi:hypothetical protein
MIIGNSKMAIRLDENNGSIISIKSGMTELTGVSTRSIPLFALRFRDAEGKILLASAHEAGRFEMMHKESDNENSLELVYAEVGEMGATVHVSVRLPHGDNQSYWRLEVEHQIELTLEWIDFPGLTVVNGLTGTEGRSRLLWPGNEGVLVDRLDIRDANKWIAYQEAEYPSRSIASIYPSAVPTQFMAYYNEHAGLYMGAHDDQGHVKLIDYYGLDGDIRLQFRLYPASEGPGLYRMDYDMVLAVFEGDWHDAAAIYRSWYLSESSTRPTALASRLDLPEWYEDSPVVVTYPVRGTQDLDNMEPNDYFPYVQALPCLEQLANAFDSRVMALLMHWEGTAPWAPPYVWPPYGGEELLAEFANGLHAKGNLLGLYCSGIGWTEQSHLVQSYNKKEQFDEQQLASVMCLSPEGELPYSAICTGQRSGYDMCPSQPFVSETVLNETERMIAGHCDYIQYFDQNHGGNSYFCYSREHSHAPAPGRWQVEAMKHLITRMNEASEKAGRKVLFGCESAAAEPFIEGLLFNDLRFNINYTIGLPVPLYAYVYHEFINNFMGNQNPTQAIVDYEHSPENLLYRLAYSFHAGDMLTIVLKDKGEITWSWGTEWNVTAPDQESVITFVRTANAWRRGAGKAYLFSGRMEKPNELKNVAQLDIVMLNGRRLTVPSVLTSKWSAQDGDQAQLVINYATESSETDVVLPELAGAVLTVVEDASGERIRKAKVSADGLLRLTLAPLQTVMIVFPKSTSSSLPDH